MFKHKKLLLSVLFLFLIAVVAACGSSNDNNGGDADNNGDNNTEASGEEVFENECMSCHGEEGEGESGPDLTGEDDHDAVVEQVEEGGDTMPAFEDDLSDDEIDAVSDYVVDELN